MARIGLGLFATLAASPASAADTLNGGTLPIFTALPFAGLLLSIALGPLLFPHVWERHFATFALGWAALTLVSLAATSDASAVITALVHAIAADYIPFVLLLLALFTTAGGIRVEGNLRANLRTNVALLLIGTALASVVGTTGASMILIRPLIRANDGRKRCVHVVIFFIFLVSNIGGALTPLGDPPLFLGFLRGVDFFWTTRFLLVETLATVAAVVAAFIAIDVFVFRRDGVAVRDATPGAPLRLRGLSNVTLIAVVIAAILVSGSWRPGISLRIAGVAFELQNVLRDVTLIAVTLASIRITPRADRLANGFSWEPIREVAWLFLGIFVCIVPVLAMLQAGAAGPFATLIQLAAHPDGSPNPLAYFWLTGGLSSFLDNAPTYLVFFQLAGGDPQTLMTAQANVLKAISLGAVFMGANSYIGNAPNFMVYAIARQASVPMPSFFGYLGWSSVILLPIYIVLSWVALR